MNSFRSIGAALAAGIASSVGFASGQADPGVAGQTPGAEPPQPFLLGPPVKDGPVVVRAAFQFQDVNEINDEAETFEFTGILTLQWNDPRQSFDPVAAGTGEKIYQGDYQFNEISPGWFPQVILANASGLYETHGVVLRVQPDGTQTLVQALNAVAEADFDLMRFPFDRQRLEAVFVVLGFDQDEVRFEAEPEIAGSPGVEVQIPQWRLGQIVMSTRDLPSAHAGKESIASSFVASVDARRQSLFIIRLVVLPLVVIVSLSFSVFWMDRSSLGDRISVSFIGILTGVAYQIVMSEILPHISYVTFMNAFLNLSFATMCATVVINLMVGALDKKGDYENGTRLDNRCRWMFPLGYFGLLLLLLGVAVVFL